MVLTDDKDLWTAKELAERTGVSLREIQRQSCRLFGKGKQGLVRYFGKMQVAQILENLNYGAPRPVGRPRKQPATPVAEG